MKKVLIALSMTLAASSAFAADAVVEDVVVVDNAYNWSGIYVGAQIGYGFGDTSVGYEGYPYDEYEWDLSPDGILGGLYLGYNYQFSNNVVLGVETDFNFGDMSDRAPLTSFGVDTDGYDMDWQQKWGGSVRARLGYAMDRWLPYVTAGASYGRFEYDLIWDGGEDGRGEETEWGWTLGVGTEYALTDNIRLRGAYSYTKFDFDGFNAEYPDGDYYDGDFKSDIDSHALTFGVSFNW